MKKTSRQKSSDLSRRLSFPDDEQRLPWLLLLLDAYAIVDTGVAIAIRDEEKRRKVKLACSNGCDICCRQKDIPLYPHELVGLYWYASEKTSGPERLSLKNRLAAHAVGSPCPFLIEGSCSAHPVRPVSCRQFNVFTASCAPGEDPYYTRREDVLVPLPDYTDRAFAAVLPFYNMKKESDLAKAIKLIRAQIMNVQEYDWKKLAAVMENGDSGKSREK